MAKSVKPKMCGTLLMLHTAQVKTSVTMEASCCSCNRYVCKEADSAHKARADLLAVLRTGWAGIMVGKKLCLFCPECAAEKLK